MYNTDPGFYIEDKWNKDPGFMVESNWDKDPGFFMPKKEGKDFLREYLSGGEEYSQAGTDIPSFGVSRSYEGGGDPRQQIPADWAEKMMKPGSPMPTGLREQIFGKPTQETPEGTLPQARGTLFPTPFSVASVPVGQDENLPMSQWAFRDAVETLRDKKRGALTKPIELSPALQDRMRTMRSSFGI